MLKHIHKTVKILGIIDLFEDLHSCLMAAMLTGINGERAALRGLRMSLHSRREIRVSGVVIRQKAALVFITGLGLPERTTKP